MNRFLERFGYGMMELTLIFPLVLFIAISFLSNPYLWIASLPFLFILGYFIRMIAGTQKRVVYLTATIFINAGVTAFFHESLLTYVLIFLANCVIFYRSILYAEREIENLISFTSLWMFGFPIYFIAFFAYRFVNRLNPYLEIITWSGILLVTITLFLSNHHMLKTSTLSKQKKPFVTGSIKGKNRAYILVILFVIAAISNLETIKHFLYKLTSTVLSMILSFLSLFEKDEPVESTLPTNEAVFPVIEKGDPSAFAVIMEKLMYVLFFGIAIVAIVFFIIFAGKKFGRLFKLGLKWLIERLNQIFKIREIEQEEEIQYIDEKVSLIDFKKWRRGKEDQAREIFSKLFSRKPKWDELSDKEKVRFAYRQVVLDEVKQGLNFNVSQTPTETVNEIKKSATEQKDLQILSETYDKARYGNKEISFPELEQVKHLVDRYE
ncbi:hypothetical protein WQ54_23340 [Bacillus sp. SA1-12]|uniref:DUF4129 domain-containing protein n=1 Tax=Bacillus sp. SA1-12 TaxID=1455638 RepID=UPI00062732F6|nr:DUF4129 domain-containing protein [Bacillus sp. SA1-12]KKI90053.1 hypothetical protein WQ54_23340 [Bacillus sp. SA1-12]